MEKDMTEIHVHCPIVSECVIRFAQNLCRNVHSHYD